MACSLPASAAFLYQRSELSALFCTPPAFFIEFAKVVHGQRQALVGGFLIAAQCFAVVLRHALAFLIHAANVVDCPGIAGSGCLVETSGRLFDNPVWCPSRSSACSRHRFGRRRCPGLQLWSSAGKILRSLALRQHPCGKDGLGWPSTANHPDLRRPETI
jgi:hypothetical protein